MTYNDILGTNKKPKEKIYSFQEPHPTGGNCTITISSSQIVKFLTEKGCKEMIQKKYPKLDVTDELLIEDFCTVYWAKEVK